jgi:CRP-like cAMP-binding protein
MIELTRLARLPFFTGMPQWALVRLADAAEEPELASGQVVLRQYDRARNVWFLVSGAVQILINVGGDDLLVAVLRDPGELIGWSALRPPYRYTASIRCEERTRLVRLPAEVFDELFERDQALGRLILHRVAVAVANRLEHARDALRAPLRQGPVGAARPDVVEESASAEAVVR